MTHSIHLGHPSAKTKSLKEKPVLHALLAVYIELLNSNDGPESEAAKTFVNAYKQDKRFVRCASIAAFFWTTRR